MSFWNVIIHPIDYRFGFIKNGIMKKIKTFIITSMMLAAVGVVGINLNLNFSDGNIDFRLENIESLAIGEEITACCKCPNSVCVYGNYVMVDYILCYL